MTYVSVWHNLCHIFCSCQSNCNKETTFLQFLLMIWQADIIRRFWKTKKLGNQTLPSIFNAIYYGYWVSYSVHFTLYFIGQSEQFTTFIRTFLDFKFPLSTRFPDKQGNKQKLKRKEKQTRHISICFDFRLLINIKHMYATWLKTYAMVWVWLI